MYEILVITYYVHTCIYTYVANFMEVIKRLKEVIKLAGKRVRLILHVLCFETPLLNSTWSAMVCHMTDLHVVA